MDFIIAYLRRIAVKAHHFHTLSNGGNPDFDSCCHSHSEFAEMLKFIAVIWEQTIVTGFFSHVTTFSSPLPLMSEGNWGSFCSLITDLTVSTPGFLWTTWSVVWFFCFEEALQCHSSHKRIPSVHTWWWYSCS